MAAELGQTTSRTLNRLAYDIANIAEGATPEASDRILMSDYSDDYELKYATYTDLLTALRTPVSITDASTYTVLAADTGKTHLIPDLGQSITIALPAVAVGLEYVFVGTGVAADASNWIFQSATAGTGFIGGMAFADTNAGAGADEIHDGVYPNGSSNDFITIVTPGAGTRVHLISTATKWVVNAQVFSAAVPTASDT